MHIATVRTTATNTARPATTPAAEVRTCVCCTVRFVVTNPEQYGCSSHRAQAWQQVIGQQLRAQAAEAAEARRKEAALEAKKINQKNFEEAAWRAYLDDGLHPDASKRSGRQVVIKTEGFSMTRHLSPTELAAVVARENLATATREAQLATLATASAPSN